MPPDLKSEEYEGYMYETLIKIGEGGMSAGIILAVMRHETDMSQQKRLVALKYIDAEYLNDPERGERRVTSLGREAESLELVKGLTDNCL